MREVQKKAFKDCLDTIIVVHKPIREEFGEDSFYCAQGTESALVSVCDGCGGLGAKKYESFQGHTGAYMAARIVSGAIRDWYHGNRHIRWKRANELAKSLDEYIRSAYQICKKRSVERRNIMGSMVRDFPTTLALLYTEKEERGILGHVVWAGDSRVYLLDEDGLGQLTLDDTDVEDAMDNLINDGAMTNVLSSDGNYHLNHKTIHIKKPTLVFAATDGCFGYVPSPMEFEYLLVKTLVESETPEMFQNSLREKLSEFVGDDFSMGLVSFFHGDFASTRKYYVERLHDLEKNYIDEENEEETMLRLWRQYKPQYERYLR